MSDEPRSLAGERADSMGVLVPPPVVFGAERLRAYALVYCRLATRAEKREASLTMEAVRELLTVVPFEEGEPAGSDASSGYSRSCDALWVRHQRILGRRRDAAAMRAVGLRAYGQQRDASVNSGLNSQALLLYPGKTLDRRLRLFMDSDALEHWRRNPVDVPSLSSVERNALARILGASVPARIPFQGYLLLGYDETVERGVIRLGVRPEPTDARSDAAWRSRVLRYPPGTFAVVPHPAGNSLPWLRRWQRLHFDRFTDDPSSFVLLCRALIRCFGDSDGRGWTLSDAEGGTVLRVRDESWFIGFLPYIGTDPLSEERLLPGVKEVLETWSSSERVTHGVIVVSDADSLSVRRRVVGVIETLRSSVIPRVMVLDRETLSGWAVQFPWAVIVFGSPGRPGAVGEEMLKFADACAAHHETEVAIKGLQWGLLHGWSFLPPGAGWEWFSRLMGLRDGNPWRILADLQPLLQHLSSRSNLTFWLDRWLEVDLLNTAAWAVPPGENAQENLTRLCCYIFEHGAHQVPVALKFEIIKGLGKEHPVAMMFEEACETANRKHPVTARLGG